MISEVQPSNNESEQGGVVTRDLESEINSEVQPSNNESEQREDKDISDKVQEEIIFKSTELDVSYPIKTMFEVEVEYLENESDKNNLKTENVVEEQVLSTEVTNVALAGEEEDNVKFEETYDVLECEYLLQQMEQQTENYEREIIEENESVDYIQIETINQQSLQIEPVMEDYKAGEHILMQVDSVNISCCADFSPLEVETLLPTKTEVSALCKNDAETM